MENKKPTKLAICGKIISIEKIGEKSLKQFASQLKLAKIDICEAVIVSLYNKLHGKDAPVAIQ